MAPHEATFSRYMDSGAYTDFEKTRLLGTRPIFVSTNLSMLYITMLYKVAIQLGMRFFLTNNLRFTKHPTLL